MDLFHLSLNSPTHCSCVAFSPSSAASLLHNSLAKANAEDEVSQMQGSIEDDFHLEDTFQMICWSGFNVSKTSQTILRQ